MDPQPLELSQMTMEANTLFLYAEIGVIVLLWALVLSGIWRMMQGNSRAYAW